MKVRRGSAALRPGLALTFGSFARQFRFLACLSGMLALFALRVSAGMPPKIQVFDGANVITNGQTNIVDFGSVQQNQAGTAVTFTVTNPGGGILQLGTLTVPSGYTVTTNPTNAISGGGISTFTVQLNSSTNGIFSGSIVISNDAFGNDPFTFPITGIVIPLPPQIQVFNGTNAIANNQITPVDFGTVVQNQTDPNITFTVTNSGGQTLDLTNITVPEGFILNTNYSSTIAAGSTGTFSVQLNSTALGTSSGNISITNNDPTNSPFVFAVTGSVITRIISLGDSLAFGVVGTGASADLVLTISNSGNADLIVSNIIFPAGFGGNFLGAIIVKPRAAQPVPVTFSPNAPTNYAGALTVVSDATSGDSTIPVSGFGANDSLVLTVITNGYGTVSPAQKGRELIATRKYTLTATAKGGNMFSNWSGSINTAKNPLTFVMESNMVLQANFITNPFLQLKGTYNGLFTNTNGVTEETAGMLNGLTIATKGTYSGKLLISGGSHAISGTFDIAGHATNHISRSASQGGLLMVEMTLLNSSNSAPQLTGTVSGTTNEVPWQAVLSANFAVKTPLSAEYTMLIPPDTNRATNVSFPGGDGYALITNNLGAAKITGALADGTAFSQSVPVSETGDIPIYANLYKGKGLLLGWINLGSSNAPGLGLSWVHPEVRGLFTNTFTSTNQILLSPWTNAPTNIFSLENLSLLETFNDPGVLTNFAITIGSGIYDWGLLTGLTNLTGAIDPRTGLVTLTIGAKMAETNGYGVVLLNTSEVRGFFLAKTNAGAIELGP